MRLEERRRVVVIGLDGGTFSVIDPLVKASRLPAISRLMATGVRGTLASTIPPSTIPAWPSFATGTNPGKHGVFGFFVRDAAKLRSVVSWDIAEPTLWRILGDHGLRSIVLNVPGTWPPEPIDGVLVSGMLTPTGATCVHPSELAQWLDARGYVVNPSARLLQEPLNRAAFLAELRRVSDVQKRTLLELMQVEGWDFAMLLFRATDIVCHKLWDDAEAVAQVYTWMDDAIGEIVAAAPGAAVILMSDHGFGPHERAFFINAWLQEQGWLNLRRRTDGEQSQAQTPTAWRWLRRAGITREALKSRLPARLALGLESRFPSGLRRWLPRTAYEIDWYRTQVASDSSFTQENAALRINVRGRDPQGIVEPGDEYEELRDRVSTALKAIRDPETGQPVVAQVYKADEIYHGPYVDRAPDLVLRLSDGYKMINRFQVREPTLQMPRIVGCHRRDGIFVAAGPGIAEGGILHDLSIVDLMPTILHYLSLYVPENCDGQVHRDVFATGSEPGRRPVVFYTPPEVTLPAGGKQDDEQVLKQLRALGYID